MNHIECDKEQIPAHNGHHGLRLKVEVENEARGRYYGEDAQTQHILDEISQQIQDICDVNQGFHWSLPIASELIVQVENNGTRVGVHRLGDRMTDLWRFRGEPVRLSNGRLDSDQPRFGEFR